MLIEETETDFEILIAYPLDSRYGSEPFDDLEDTMREDMVRIDSRLGISSTARYPDGLAMFALDSYDIERNETVLFLSMTYRVIFNRAIDLGPIPFESATVGNAAIAWATTALAGIEMSATGSASLALTSAGTASIELGAYSIDTITPAQIASILGKPEPTLMWRGSDSSGATELVTGTDHLVDVGTVIHNTTDATLGGVIADLDTAASDALNTSSSTVADIGAETVTIMHICRPTLYGTTNLFTKRDAGAPNIGYEIFNLSSGAMYWVCDSASGSKTNAVTVAHGTTNAQTILVTRESTANNQAIYTREGSAAASRFDQSLVNTTTFKIGKGRLNATTQKFGMCAIWIGTDGDGFGETERLALAQAFGYEA